MKPFLALLAALVCAGTGWAVYESSLAATAAPAPKEAKAPPVVRIEPVRRQLVEERIDVVGGLEPEGSVELRAAVAGYVVKLPFDLGDYVEAGTIVAELDDAAAKELVSRSEAALRVAQARLKAQEATAEHARGELARWQKLAQNGVSTPQQLAAASAQLAIAESQVELEHAQVEQAKAELEQARLQLEQTRVRAPSSGFVAARLVSVGHLATPDLPLLRLVSIDTVRTVVHVPERDYGQIRGGLAATITVDALPGRHFTGKVVRKAPVLDPVTRTAAVEIEIPNPETLLKPGMHARVSIVSDQRNATVVPLAAVREEATGRSLYVVSQDPVIARRVQVDVGVVVGDVVEVRGLADEDWVVTLGHDQISAEGPVTALRSDTFDNLMAEDAESELLAGGGG
jgi:RND family efflux transporter MFP subunit